MACLTRFCVLLAPVFLLSPSASHAASFDCAKASEAHERLICADPALSKQDEEMARLFAAARQGLSEEGKRLLTAGQRSWIAFLHKLCPVLPAAAKEEAATAGHDCVSGEYDSRIDALKRAQTMSGPFRFMRVESFEARKGSADDETANHPGIDERQRAIPRIDAPASAEASRWNERVAAFASKLAGKPDMEEGDDDTWLDYEIAFASPALISVAFTLSIYGHGAAHPLSAGAVFNFLFAAGEAFKPADLFDAKAGWQGFLAKRCFEDLKRQDVLGDPPDFPGTPDGLKEMVADPGRWQLDAKGLTVKFNIYEVAPYAAGPQEVAIPWQELKPYLAASPPFPIPPG
jgi:uncharacterized protein